MTLQAHGTYKGSPYLSEVNTIPGSSYTSHIYGNDVYFNQLYASPSDAVANEINRLVPVLVYLNSSVPCNLIS